VPCHVTLRAGRGLPSWRTKPLARELRRSLAALSDRCDDFRVVHFSLQADHAHFLVEARDRAALGRGMMALGSRLARAVNRVFRRSGRVLAERYHLRRLASPREVRNALAYVLGNGRKHAAERGVDVRLKVDPASSAPWFDGWRRPPSLAPPGGASGVSPPRTWLLRIGWRRFGLLDWRRTPGSARAAEAARSVV
jgi:REP element-mobilizing transposase RayT